MMETRTLSIWRLVFCVFAVFVLLAPAASVSGQLMVDFYSLSCPAAEDMVRNTVRSATSNDPSVPGRLLRLLFHDCFVEGCDASVLIRGNGTEQSDPSNQSLGGFSVIDSAKRVLELFCPGVVSCADIVALAARDAVALTGGPAVEIPTGRRDGRVSLVSNVRPNIVDTSFSMDEMIKIFSSKGLSLEDLVLLSGAHTIGSAHCGSFSDRFRKDPTGRLVPVDASLDRSFAEELMERCPVGFDPSITVSNDPQTSSSFDNQYFRNLMAGRGLFQSDSVLFSDARTSNLVEAFADDQESFFAGWAQSFVRLTSIDVKGDGEGEIRLSCSVVNAE
ncbi:hypothetical protein SAY87_019082 [Trapa incisa]|uniref:Peroxidase n=1 Tax=Trapa incisa TaxID=236973 RepID=A0AAN7K101_9MYRT|nr:hypothetical protein SAY87_019082 [Trapa incisa]